MYERNIEYSDKAPQTWLKLADWKKHARITSTSEDVINQVKIDAIADHIEKVTGKRICDVKATIKYSGFPPRRYNEWRKLFLGVAPVRSIISVSYLNNVGQAVTLTSGTDYNEQLSGDNPYLLDAYCKPWPWDIARHQPNIVTVVAQCGLQDQSTVDGNFVLAAWMLAGLLNQNREGETFNGKYEELPGYASIEAMLAPLRRMTT